MVQFANRIGEPPLDRSRWIALPARAWTLLYLYAVALVAIPAGQVSLQPQNSQSLLVLPNVQLRSAGEGSGMGAAIQDLQAPHLSPPQQAGGERLQNPGHLPTLPGP